MTSLPYKYKHEAHAMASVGKEYSRLFAHREKMAKLEKWTWSLYNIWWFWNHPQAVVAFKQLPLNFRQPLNAGH